MNGSKFGGLEISHVAAALVSIGALVGALGAQAAVVVAPNANENLEGDQLNCAALGGCGDVDHYQQVFASSQFGALSEPELITQIAFRFGFTGSISNSFSNVLISLSTTAAAPDGLSSTFIANRGADFTTVASGPLTLSTSSLPPGLPRPFDVVMVLDTPFLYNPASGNLLFEWQNFGGQDFVGSFYDTVTVTGDSVSRVWSSGGGPNTLSGNLDSIGFIVQFTTTPAAAPAPGTLPLLGLALLGFGLRGGFSLRNR